jgi:hypothetical protein
VSTDLDTPIDLWPVDLDAAVPYLLVPTRRGQGGPRGTQADA